MDPPIPNQSDVDRSLTTNRRWVLTHFDEVLTVNKERTVHWSHRAEVVGRWREAYGWLVIAEKMPYDLSVGGCHIDAIPLAPKKRSQDVAACLPVVKAAIDGLVDAGVWKDDSPEWVRSLRFWPQQYGRDTGLRLVITEDE